MKCRFCDRPIPEDLSFCRVCWRRLPEELRRDVNRARRRFRRQPCAERLEDVVTAQRAILAMVPQ